MLRAASIMFPATMRMLPQTDEVLLAIVSRLDQVDLLMEGLQRRHHCSWNILLKPARFATRVLNQSKDPEQDLEWRRNCAVSI